MENARRLMVPLRGRRMVKSAHTITLLLVATYTSTLIQNLKNVCVARLRAGIITGSHEQGEPATFEVEGQIQHGKQTKRMSIR